MGTGAGDESGRSRVGATVGVFVALGAVACALTLLYLGMRAVMDVGGFCAEGGAFQIRQHCPHGIPLVMMSAIWGGLIFVGLYVWVTARGNVPSLVLLLWPALFLSLGWNFFDYALHPPGGGGLVGGWLFCGILFALMGAAPLPFFLRSAYRSFTESPAAEPSSPSVLSQWGSLLSGLSELSSSGPTVGESIPPAVWGKGGGWVGSPSTAPPATVVPSGPGAVSDAGASSDAGMVAELERLNYLHRSGGLTDDEYEAAKRKIIEGDG